MTTLQDRSPFCVLRSAFVTDFLAAVAIGPNVRSVTPQAAAALAVYLGGLEARNARLEAALRRFVASEEYCDTMRRGRAACGGVCRWCEGRAALLNAERKT